MRAIESIAEDSVPQVPSPSLETLELPCGAHSRLRILARSQLMVVTKGPWLFPSTHSGESWSYLLPHAHSPLLLQAFIPSAETRRLGLPYHVDRSRGFSCHYAHCWLARHPEGWRAIILGPFRYVHRKFRMRVDSEPFPGAWCWIGDTYQVERLVYLYVRDFSALSALDPVLGFTYTFLFHSSGFS